MAEITFKGKVFHTSGDLPTTGKTPNFILTKSDLNDVTLENFSGKKVIMNIFPSIDTAVCATSVRKFNERATSLNNTVVLCISADLPFAHARFCGAEGIKNVVTLSEFRKHSFGEDYGIRIVDGPFAGLLARSVVVLDENGHILHTELVQEIGNEPNYEAAISALK